MSNTGFHRFANALTEEDDSTVSDVALRNLHTFLTRLGVDPVAVARGERVEAPEPCDVFVIEKAWVDSMENGASNAFGYRPVGFVRTAKEANAIIDNGGMAPKCWANTGTEPLFRKVRLQRVEEGGADE